jgi:hypothetical protein
VGPDENSTAETLYFKTEDHGYVQVPSNILPFLDLEFDDEEAHKRALAIRSTSTFRFDLHIKNFVKMSKKRFKKILMSKGLSRDDADFLCYTVGWLNGKVCYSDIYLNTLFLQTSVPCYEVFDYILTKGECAEWIKTK